MSPWWWLLHLAVGAFSALVCGYCLLRLLDPNARIPLRQVHRWRAAGALPLLALGTFQALLGEATRLQCTREPSALRCELVRSSLRGHEAQALPANALIGAEVDERVEQDHEGNPTVLRRVALVTRQGRIALSRWDQGDALAMRDEIVAFLSDGRRRTLDAGVDDRAFHWLVAPMWIGCGMLVLLGRWD